ncbi:MAG: hypothetical protein U0670_10855 [Anaerolineae bacterium]
MTHLKTERLSGESIIVSTYIENITVQDIAESSPYIEGHVRAIGGLIYYIIDVRQTKSTFKDILDILRMPQDDGQMEAEAAGIDFRLMMVGNDALAKFFVQAAQQQQYGHMQIPLFATLEAAIDAARTGLALAHDSRHTQSGAAAD